MFNFKGKLHLPKISFAGMKDVFTLQRFRTASTDRTDESGFNFDRKVKVPFRKNKKLQRSLSLSACAVLMLVAGTWLGLWRDYQSIYYDIGMQAYQYAAGAGTDESPVKTPAAQAKMIATSVKAFESSVAIYKIRTHEDWIHRFLFPRPDRHVAALAAFQIGKIMIRVQKPKEAVDALKTYLMINPGGPTDAYSEDTIVVQYDLELLYKQNPDLQQQEGKGQPKPGDGQDDGNQQAPDQQPGNQAGHMTPSKL